MTGSRKSVFAVSPFARPELQRPTPLSETFREKCAPATRSLRPGFPEDLRPLPFSESFLEYAPRDEWEARLQLIEQRSHHSGQRWASSDAMGVELAEILS